MPLWRPEILPTAVILTQAPAGFARAASLDNALLAAAITQSEIADGHHIRLPGDHQLWLLNSRPDQPLAAVIPLDDDLLIRAAGALRLHQLITAQKIAPIPRSQSVSSQQRSRVIQMLLALDGHRSQATYREIASALLDTGVATDKSWKTHPIRGRTIRLVNDAMKIVNRGYLKLLHGRLPR